MHIEDGSTITMNTRSRMRVWLTRHARDIELLEGEALFSVAHDPSRPFRVHVGHTVVEAVGTEFSVYRGEHGTKVSVVEGRVKIFAYQSPAPLILNPNAVAWTDVGASDFERPPPPIPVAAREEAQVSTEGGGTSRLRCRKARRQPTGPRAPPRVGERTSHFRECDPRGDCRGIQPLQPAETRNRRPSLGTDPPRRGIRAARMSMSSLSSSIRCSAFGLFRRAGPTPAPRSFSSSAAPPGHRNPASACYAFFDEQQHRRSHVGPHSGSP